MADAPAAPARKKGFSLSKPGTKEYLIIGGIALAAGLVYFWWKNKQAAAAGSSAGTGSPEGPASSPTGLSLAQLMLWIHDQQSSPAPSTATTTTTSTKAAPKHHVPVKSEGGDKVRIGSDSDLYYLAKQFGVTEKELVAANPSLKRYEGTGKAIPSGTVIANPAKKK
jgi:hypothetical protein